MWIPGDNYLSAEEFRKLCGYASTRTIYDAIREGRLDAIDFYGTPMIRKTAIIRVNKRGRKKKQNE
jgi:hypothetical protein